MNTRGRDARRRPGVLAWAVLLAAGLACNAGAGESSGSGPITGEIAPDDPPETDGRSDGAYASDPASAGGRAADSGNPVPANPAPAGGSEETSSSTGANTAPTDSEKSNTGNSGGFIQLGGAQSSENLSTELDFGGGGAGGCPDPCGFCAEDGDDTTYEPIFEPTLLYTYQSETDYVVLPDAHTTACACGFLDDEFDAISVDPPVPGVLLALDAEYRDEVESYCAVADVDFPPGTLPGDYYLSLEHWAGSVTAWIDVRAAAHPDVRWFYDDEVWFAGFEPYEAVDVYFWAAGVPVQAEATATYLGMTSGSANELGDVYVDAYVDGVEATVIGVTAASGEVVGCKEGPDYMCLTVSGVPLEDIIFRRIDP